MYAWVVRCHMKKIEADGKGNDPTGGKPTVTLTGQALASYARQMCAACMQLALQLRRVLGRDGRREARQEDTAR